MMLFALLAVAVAPPIIPHSRCADRFAHARNHAAALVPAFATATLVQSTDHVELRVDAPFQLTARVQRAPAAPPTDWLRHDTVDDLALARRSTDHAALITLRDPPDRREAMLVHRVIARFLQTAVEDCLRQFD